MGSVCVHSIKPGGLVAGWNLAHPGLKVLPGDLFVAVNNQYGDVCRGLSSKTHITIEVQRSTSRPAPSAEGGDAVDDFYRDLIWQGRRLGRPFVAARALRPCGLAGLDAAFAATAAGPPLAGDLGGASAGSEGGASSGSGDSDGSALSELPVKAQRRHPWYGASIVRDVDGSLLAARVVSIARISGGHRLVFRIRYADGDVDAISACSVRRGRRLARAQRGGPGG